MIGPFFSSKLWIAQAREDLSDFHARERAVFSKEHAYSVFEDLDRQPGAKVVGIKLSPAPDTLSTKAANIVGALRSALDQAIWRASVELGAAEEKIIYFPLAGSKSNFDDMFREKGRCKNIPSSLHPLLKGFEGYPRSQEYAGGNDLLYALSPISNPNKHRETYQVGIEFSGGGSMKHFDAEVIVNMAFPPRFDASKNEIVLFTTSLTGKYSVDMALPAYIAFGEVPIVARQQVVPVLGKMVSIVEGVVLGLEAETARILSERAP